MCFQVHLYEAAMLPLIGLERTYMTFPDLKISFLRIHRYFRKLSATKVLLLEATRWLCFVWSFNVLLQYSLTFKFHFWGFIGILKITWFHIFEAVKWISNGFIYMYFVWNMFTYRYKLGFISVIWPFLKKDFVLPKILIALRFCWHIDHPYRYTFYLCIKKKVDRQTDGLGHPSRPSGRK